MLDSYELSAAALARSRASAWARRLALPVVAVGVSLGIASARFGLQTPSLIDEWFGVAYGGRAFHALLHGDYLAGGWDFQGRYRPGYTAIWNYAQWHLLGSPSMAVSAVWGVARILAFFCAIWILARWVAGRHLQVPEAAVLLAPIAVVLTPSISVDLARFGPGEPMMISGVVIGLASMYRGFRSAMEGPRTFARIALTALLLAGGYVIFLVGVYSKECSAGLLVFVPFFAKWASSSLRAILRRSRLAAASVLMFATLILAPIVHVACRLVFAGLSGASPWPNADLTLQRKIVSAAITPFLGVPGVLRTWLWFFASLAAAAATLVMVRQRNRDAWLLGGVLLTGFAVSAIPLARGPTPTWYYIPAVVGIAAVAFRGVVNRSGKAAAAAAVCVAVLVPSGTPSALGDWSRAQRSGAEAIDLTKGLVTANCATYVSGFDIEQRLAIPLLFRFAHPRPFAQCDPDRSQAYVVSWERKPIPLAFSSHCRTNWIQLKTSTGVALFRCRSFRPVTVLDQYAASGEPTVKLVELRLPRNDPLPRNLFQPVHTEQRAGVQQ